MQSIVSRVNPSSIDARGRPDCSVKIPDCRFYVTGARLHKSSLKEAHPRCLDARVRFLRPAASRGALATPATETRLRVALGYSAS
jgi:hypothetical protein